MSCNGQLNLAGVQRRRATHAVIVNRAAAAMKVECRKHVELLTVISVSLSLSQRRLSRLYCDDVTVVYSESTTDVQKVL